jgi:hypothetical protein
LDRRFLDLGEQSSAANSEPAGLEPANPLPILVEDTL